MSKFKIKTPDALLKYWNDYLAWCIKNPVMEKSAVYNARHDKWVDRPHTRPTTEADFGRYVGEYGPTKNVRDYLRNKNGGYDDYVDVSVFIKTSIEATLIQGGLLRILDPNIVARIVGLANKEVTEDVSTNKKPLTIQIVKNTDNKKV